MSEGGTLSKDITLGAGSPAIANPERPAPGAAADHEVLSATCPGQARLEGRWVHGDGFVEWAGGARGTLTVTNTAARLEVEMSSADGSDHVVAVVEDGPPLDREWCGADCDEDPEHGAATRVAERRFYEIVTRPELETHELQLVPTRAGLRVHAIRFHA